MVILSASRQYHQFNTITSSILSYKSTIYKSHNNPNQYIFLTIYPSVNTRSGSTASKETLYIVPTTSINSLSLLKYNLDNIHNDIKAMTYKHRSDMKTLNENISDMLTKLTYTSSKIDKQEEQPIDISSKLSIYGYLLNKLRIK